MNYDFKGNSIDIMGFYFHESFRDDFVLPRTVGPWIVRTDGSEEYPLVRDHGLWAYISIDPDGEITQNMLDDFFPGSLIKQRVFREKRWSPWFDY